jgi:hypothetical protein
MTSILHGDSAGIGIDAGLRCRIGGIAEMRERIDRRDKYNGAGAALSHRLENDVGEGDDAGEIEVHFGADLVGVEARRSSRPVSSRHC